MLFMFLFTTTRGYVSCSRTSKPLKSVECNTYYKPVSRCRIGGEWRKEEESEGGGGTGGGRMEGREGDGSVCISKEVGCLALLAGSPA